MPGILYIAFKIFGCYLFPSPMYRRGQKFLGFKKEKVQQFFSGAFSIAPAKYSVEILEIPVSPYPHPRKILGIHWQVSDGFDGFVF
jgi:hypothetical protein